MSKAVPCGRMDQADACPGHEIGTSILTGLGTVCAPLPEGEPSCFKFREWRVR